MSEPRMLIDNTIAHKEHGNVHGFWVGHPTAEAKKASQRQTGVGLLP